MNEKGIDQAEWRPLHAIDKARLSEARLQAHYAAQWLARAARAYVPPQPDDGHTSLSLDRALDGFVTHPFKNGMRLSLQVTNLSLTLRDRDGAAVVESIFLNGHSDSQIRQSLGDKLSKLNLDARALDAPSPYEIPAHAIAQGSHYDAIGSSAALTELALLRRAIFLRICVSKTRFNNASDLADVRPLAHTRIHGRYCSGSQNFIGNRSED